MLIPLFCFLPAGHLEQVSYLATGSLVFLAAALVLTPPTSLLGSDSSFPFTLAAKFPSALCTEGLMSILGLRVLEAEAPLGQACAL